MALLLHSKKNTSKLLKNSILFVSQLIIFSFDVIKENFKTKTKEKYIPPIQKSLNKRKNQSEKVMKNKQVIN